MHFATPPFHRPWQTASTELISTFIDGEKYDNCHFCYERTASVRNLYGLHLCLPCHITYSRRYPQNYRFPYNSFTNNPCNSNSTQTVKRIGESIHRGSSNFPNTARQFCKYIEVSSPTKSSQTKGIKRERNQKMKRCDNCLTTVTGCWRKGLNNEMLCNACGLYIKLRKIHRLPIAKIPRKRNAARSSMKNIDNCAEPPTKKTKLLISSYNDITSHHSDVSSSEFYGSISGNTASYPSDDNFVPYLKNASFESGYNPGCESEKRFEDDEVFLSNEDSQFLENTQKKSLWGNLPHTSSVPFTQPLSVATSSHCAHLSQPKSEPISAEYRLSQSSTNPSVPLNQPLFIATNNNFSSKLSHYPPKMIPHTTGSFLPRQPLSSGYYSGTDESFCCDFTPANNVATNNYHKSSTGISPPEISFSEIASNLSRSCAVSLNSYPHSPASLTHLDAPRNILISTGAISNNTDEGDTVQDTQRSSLNISPMDDTYQDGRSDNFSGKLEWRSLSHHAPNFANDNNFYQNFLEDSSVNSNVNDLKADATDEICIKSENVLNGDFNTFNSSFPLQKPYYNNSTSSFNDSMVTIPYCGSYCDTTTSCFHDVVYHDL